MVEHLAYNEKVNGSNPLLLINQITNKLHHGKILK